VSASQTSLGDMSSGIECAVPSAYARAQAALLATRAAEELLGEALSAEGPKSGAPGAQAAGAAAVADAVTLTLSAAAAAAAGGEAWAAQLRARLLDVLSQLTMPLVRHALASGRDAQARRPRHHARLALLALLERSAVAQPGLLLPTRANMRRLSLAPATACVARRAISAPARHLTCMRRARAQRASHAPTRRRRCSHSRWPRRAARCGSRGWRRPQPRACCAHARAPLPTSWPCRRAPWTRCCTRSRPPPAWTLRRAAPRAPRAARSALCMPAREVGTFQSDGAT